jgi:hypothetical protein
MPESMSRRGFLAKSSIAAATGAAATLAASSGLLTVQGVLAAPSTPSLGGDATDDVTPVGHDVVAHVRNESTGEIAVMVGEHEVVYSDRALVARLLTGARQAGREV